MGWIAGFSSDFAGQVIDEYVVRARRRRKALVLDPFAGVATTLVEAQRRGIRSVGYEINPYAALVAQAKLHAAYVDHAAFVREIGRYADKLTTLEDRLDGGKPVPSPSSIPPPGFRTRAEFFSPAVQRKVLHNLDYIQSIDDRRLSTLFRLAFASTMVSYSNYSYEPSLSTRSGAGKQQITEACVAGAITEKLRQMAEDIAAHQVELARLTVIPAPDVRPSSFFTGASDLQKGSVDLVLTSPPYLNNYHYVRNTRPQLYWLGYISSPGDQLKFETESFGRYWQRVRHGPDVDLVFELPGLSRRLKSLWHVDEEKGPYGGVGWAKYATTYYNDCYRMVVEFARLLRSGGSAVIVVGNTVLQGLEFRVDRDLVAIGELVGLQGHVEIVRNERQGSSTIGTGTRQSARRPARLYEAAVVLEKRSS
jgi:DNA modification methylase